MARCPLSAATSPFDISIQVLSLTSNQTDTKVFHPQVKQLVAKWTDETINMEFDDAAATGLNALVTNTQDLNVTLGPADKTANFDPKYWDLKNVGGSYTLQRSALGRWTDTSQPFPTDATTNSGTVIVPLIATNTTSAEPGIGHITYNLSVPTFSWSSSSLPGTVQAGHDYNASALNNLGLISGGINGDTYTFSIQTGDTNTCTITAPDQLKCPASQATDLDSNGDGVFYVTLTAKSNTTGAALSGKKFPVIVQPGFHNDSTGFGIKFDDLTGIILNEPANPQTPTPIMYNPHKLPVTCKLLTGGNYKAANWEVSTAIDSNTGVSSCFVKRKANSGEIDASDIGNVTLPIQITYGTNLSNKSAITANVLPTVNPDSNLTYQFVDPHSLYIKGVFVSAGVAVNGYSTPAPITLVYNPNDPTKTYVQAISIQGGNTYKVIGDSAYTFTNPGGSPSFVSYNFNINSIYFLYPDKSYLGKTNLPLPLTAGSLANGKIEKSVEMPSINVNQLTISTSTGFFTSKYRGNVGGGGVGDCAMRNVTYYTITGIPNVKYRLVNVAVTFPNKTNTPYRQICPYPYGTTTDSTPTAVPKASNNCPASKEVAGSNTDATTFDILPSNSTKTATNGGVTLLISAGCLSDSSYPTFNTSTNIVLEIAQ